MKTFRFLLDSSREGWEEAFSEMAAGCGRFRMGMVTGQYDIFLINLDPALGHEIKKTRPCVIISPDEMNNQIGTVIIAPMTTKSKAYPTRVSIEFQLKEGWIVLDRIRTVDKIRLIKKLGSLKNEQKRKVKQVLQAMLVD